MDDRDTTTARGPAFGRFEAAVSRLFTRAASVSEAVTVADGFRRIRLEGPDLRGVAWAPGQKLQIMLGGWAARTFTPMSWDAEAGITELLVYTHGAGPGAAWAEQLRGGESCLAFGPRRSLDLSALTGQPLLFGDETSIGLARALRGAGFGAARVVLEVTAPAAAAAALEAVGLSGATLVQRRPDDSHLKELEAELETWSRAEGLDSCVLSGKAGSIAVLHRALRRLGVARGRVLSKAYWAPGKRGLD
jgi:NADPH-dependent ferric siderophore reductase